jgi:hypothetical protein
MPFHNIDRMFRCGADDFTTHHQLDHRRHPRKKRFRNLGHSRGQLSSRSLKHGEIRKVLHEEPKVLYINRYVTALTSGVTRWDRRKDVAADFTTIKDRLSSWRLCRILQALFQNTVFCIVFHSCLK